MINICQVSLKENIPTIIKNQNNFKKFYNNVSFFIICPLNQLEIFQNNIQSSDCKILSEESIISFENFKLISEKYLKQKSYYNEIQLRLSWYYQQILKISYLIDFITENKKDMIIWDADTILLKKIHFFNKEYSIRYGTTSEFFRAYYVTNKIILGKLPKYFISSLTQFIALSVVENNFFIKNLRNFKEKTQTTGEWLTNIVFKAVCDAHEKYNGSMFSEYELIGQSKLLLKYKNQKLTSGIREGLCGTLSELQLKIVKLLGYNYVTYEQNHANNQYILIQKQEWFSFIKLLIRKTSNKIYRGAKHLIISKLI